jgi:hypothetical protein
MSYRLVKKFSSVVAVTCYTELNYSSVEKFTPVAAVTFICPLDSKEQNISEDFINLEY